MCCHNFCWELLRIRDIEEKRTAKAPTKEEDLMGEEPLLSKCTLTDDDLHKLKHVVIR